MEAKKNSLDNKLEGDIPCMDQCLQLLQTPLLAKEFPQLASNVMECCFQKPVIYTKVLILMKLLTNSTKVKA